MMMPTMGLLMTMQVTVVVTMLVIGVDMKATNVMMTMLLMECSHRPSGRQRRSGLRQQAPDFALALLRPALDVWIPR